MKTFSRVVVLRGHIIDSLTFPKVLDEILGCGAEYETEEIVIGKTQKDPSSARIRVTAIAEETLDKVISQIGRLGAEAVEEEDVRLVPATGDGFFPEGFYATTNFPTRVRYGGRFLDVEDLCMDSGIHVSGDEIRARCVRCPG